MAKKIDTDARIAKIRIQEQSSHPSAADAGFGWLYERSTQHPYFENASGTIYPLAGLVSDRKKRTTGDYITGSTVFVDLDPTNMVISLTSNNRSRYLIVLTCWGTNSSAAQNTSVDMNIDGIREGGIYGLVTGVGTNNNFSFSLTTDFLQSGTHTFKPMYRADGGTATIYGTTGTVSPVIFSVTELQN